MIIAAIPIFAIAFAPLVQSPFPTQRVTYTGAETAANLLKEISKSSGIHFGAGRETAEDFLVASFKDRPLDEVMRQIARTDAAEWKEERDGWYLIRSNSLVQKLAAAESELRAKAIEVELNKLRGRKRPPALTPESAAKLAVDLNAFSNQEEAVGRDPKKRQDDMDNLIARNPGSYAIAASVACLDPELLGRQHRPFRLVFSSDPTPMQLPMPPGVSDIVGYYLENFKLLVQIYADRFDVATTRSFHYDDLSTPMYISGDLKKGPGKVLLIARGDGVNPEVTCELQVFDPDGKLIDENSTKISYSIERPDSSIKERSGESPIQLSPLADEMVKNYTTASIALSQTWSMSSNDAQGQFRLVLWGNPEIRRNPGISDSLKAAILNPVDRDPLSFAASEALLQAARSRGESLIASLPDSLFAASNTVLRGAKIKPSDFLRSNAVSSSLELKESNGWLTGSSWTPALDSEYRVDRAALTKLMGALNSKGYLSLDDYADYSLTALRAPRGIGPDGVYLRMLDPTLVYVADKVQWPLIRYYGSLTSAERQALATGVTYQNMGHEKQAALSDYVFCDPAGPGIAVPNVVDERTEVLPRGLPSNATLTTESSSSTGALATNSVLGGSQILTPEKLADFRIQADLPDLVTNIGVAPVFDRFRPFSIKTIHFHLNLAPGVTMERSLTDAKPVSGGPAITYDQMPQEFKDAVEARYKVLKQHLMPAGGTKPPPRT